MTRVVLDVGTSRIRAGVLGPDGAWQQRIQATGPALLRRGDRVEQDAGQVARTVDALLGELDVHGPAAVALTCQRGTTVLLDQEGEAMAPLVSWQDRRARGVPDWYERHEPARWGRVDRVMSLAAWLAMRWTGEAVEHPSTQSPWGNGSIQASPDGVALLPSSPIGAGRLYCAGGDKNCELLGASGGKAGAWAVSAGTALSLGALVAAAEPHVAGTFRTPSPHPGQDTVEVGLPVGGSVVQQLAPKWGPLPDRLELPAVDGPMCVPYFGGSLLDPHAREQFIGLSGDESAAIRWGAVLEGMVLELRYASQRLPQPVGPIGAVGGLMSAWLAQCIADAFGTDVLWYPGDYIGLAGAAMACGWDAPMGRGTRFAPRSPDRWSTRLTIYLELLARKRMEDS